MSETRQAIFVTGAGAGIGRATARLFAARGWNVGLFDVDEAALAAVQAELGAGSTLARRLDVRSAEDCAAAVAGFEERFGRMDVLFNCAGVLTAGRFAEVPLAAHVRCVEINVLGVLHCTHAAIPLLRRTPGAHVVSMGSASGIYGVPEIATYSASKFFVRGFTEALSLELERDGIVVTDLMPLWVRTALVQQEHTPGSLRTFGARLSPEQVAELVWKAAHARRVHWIPGPLLKLLSWFGGAVPAASRPTMKRVCGV